MGPRLPVSCFIIAKNERDRIGAVIAAVRDLVDEVLVVDSGSTDGTQDLASSLGARVVHNDWHGYGPQKRFAEEACRNDWLLNLDADEVPDETLLRSIAALFAAGGPDAKFHAFKIALVYPGEDRPRRFADGPSPVRLYDRRAGRYSDSPVHDRVVLPKGARVGRLHGEAAHFSYRSFGALVEKLNGYSDLQARTLKRGGRTRLLVRLPFEMPLAFVKYYLARRHILGGWRGFVFASINAFYRFLRLAKMLETSDRGSGGREVGD
ncbi:glycosyltransferase family 2 protein [Lutibaculum baratangense]|uniref:Beta 1,4 glucosyltransferase n=1 Tax=Lutibaculum baratangense AMV1 TaxID=631454 RepID=V4RDS2_9HYPH|nr:glycosyltransferase family 2 protein [Lutibaculum baratangense]ESR23519.1 Beta 1,4 glucosyltransferase [Lutibaculum baratangense AMV1]